MFSRFARSPIQNILLLSTILISIIFQHPQPELDLDYYTSLASDYTLSTNNADTPLHGVNIVITGATSGIGLSLTKMLHTLGGTIIVVGRNQSKLDKLESELNYKDDDGSDKNEEKRQQKRIVPILADFKDMDSVSAAADAIRSKFKTIDMLINNAGIVDSGGVERSTQQGYEIVFGVNYLSHFLLTEKLLSSLKRSKLTNGSRIIQITSKWHYMVNGDDLVPTSIGGPSASQPSTSFDISNSYGNSKLAQIYHMRSLALELHSSSDRGEAGRNNVEIVSLCPSWVATDITGANTMFGTFVKVFGFPSDGFGIAPILHAMFHPYAGFVGGDYVDSCKSMSLIMNYLPGKVKMIGAIPFLIFQKYFADVHFAESSPDSYDVVKRDALYKWSKEAVEPWMK